MGASAAYVYHRSGDEWFYQAKLTAPDGSFADRFGHAVAIYGDEVFVGAPQFEYNGIALNGKVYVFLRDGASWTYSSSLVVNGYSHQSLRR